MGRAMWENRKRCLIILLGILLIASVAVAENIQTVTELGGISKKLEEGVTIEKAYYTDGYGFSTSEFTTVIPEEISQLWDAVKAIEVGDKTDMSVTDWYPQIVFYLSDGTWGGIRFEANWLCIGVDNYEISNDETFWKLKDSLVKKYENLREDAVKPTDAAWDGTPEGKYCFGVKEIADDHLALSLYAEDLYDRNTVENMKHGDVVMVHGSLYTVEFVRIHGMYDSDDDGEIDLSCTFVKNLDQDLQKILDRYKLNDEDFREAPESFVLTSYEIYPVEEIWGYIAFEPVSESECRCVMDDWSPCRYLADVTVELPLPERFVFLDYLDDEHDAQTFLNEVSKEWYSPYNSHAWFENGQLVKVSHSDYPEGPMW